MFPYSKAFSISKVFADEKLNVAQHIESVFNPFPNDKF